MYVYIYIYIFINIKNSDKPETVHRYWPVSEIYHTGDQTGTASDTVLTSLKLSHYPVKKNTNTLVNLNDPISKKKRKNVSLVKQKFIAQVLVMAAK